MNLVKVAGYVHDLRIGEQLLTEANYQKQGLATAALSTVLGQASPGSIILAGNKGIKMYSIQFRINNKLYQAAFTGLHFREGDYVIVVYDEDDYFKTYAVLNPEKGILSMPFDTGYSLKVNRSRVINLYLFFTIGSIIFSFIILFFLESFELFFIFLFFTTAIFFFFFFFLYDYLKQKKFCILSENIFSILKFKNIENIDMSGHEVESDLNNMQNFDFRYREAVDYDPYPPEIIPKNKASLD